MEDSSKELRGLLLLKPEHEQGNRDRAWGQHFYGFGCVLRLQAQVYPLDVAGENHMLARGAGYQVYVSMEVEFGPNRSIDKADIETFDIDGCGDALAELGERVPDHVLLLDIEVVEGGDMTAWGHDQLAGGEGRGMRHGDHKFCRHPSVFG
jgi:hypothetical protein